MGFSLSALCMVFGILSRSCLGVLREENSKAHTRRLFTQQGYSHMLMPQGTSRRMMDQNYDA